MPGVPTRILIWGKTYPELSTRYRETVCTGGCTEDGRPVRIYPVPLRYLRELQRYRLYSWIEAPIEPNPKDSRPESFRITDPRQLRVLERLGTRRGWLERRRVIFRDPSWHFNCLDDLKAEQQRCQISLGLVRVGAVDRVELQWRSPEERTKHEEKLAALQQRSDFFLSPPKQLQFLSFRIRLHWRCERMDRTKVCPGHTASILDWGLGELGRREGADQALQKMEEISDLNRFDLHLFLGNMKGRRHVFPIVGLWYPKRADVLRYPLEPSLFDPPRTAVLPPSRDDETQPQLDLL